MPPSVEQRLIDLEVKAAFQERTLSELDEQLRWALGQVRGLERRLARAEARLVGETGAERIEEVGYGEGDGPPPRHQEPEGRA